MTSRAKTPVPGNIVRDTVATAVCWTLVGIAIGAAVLSLAGACGG